jgi:hypothetical protein
MGLKSLPGFGRERSSFSGSPLAVPMEVQGISQQGLKLAALKLVLEFLNHWLACFLLRESNRASSILPRLIRDFTVPSGTFSTCAMSL